MTSRENIPAQVLNRDSEITSAEDDRLGRTVFAERVARRISAAGEGASVVFGLAGPWGSGKTSALNLIQEALEAAEGKDWAVVQFTPWAAADPYSLVEEFYSAIAAAMPRDDKGEKARALLHAAAPAMVAAAKAGATALINKYFGPDAVAKVLDAATGAAASQLGEIELGSPDPFQERFKKLSEAVSEAGRNVLVVVDDVDRLHTDELLAMMKAVRLLGRFNRVHYLLSYDERTVLDVLTSSDIASNDRGRARAYLEKIVQYPFMLPPIQRVHLENELSAQLREVFNRHEFAYPEPNGMDPVREATEALMPMDGLTLRTIHRLAGQVDVMITLVGGSREVDFADAAVLTFLRLRFPDLYSWLPLWRGDLIDRPVGPNSSGPDETEWRERIGLLVGHADRDRASRDIRAARNLLAFMFPVYAGATKTNFLTSRRSPRGVRHDEYFGRYFAFSFLEGDISDAEVHAAFAHLITTGAHQSLCIIAQAIETRESAGRVTRKMSRVLIETPKLRRDPAQLARAAQTLSHELKNTDKLDFRIFWLPVLARLLGYAIRQPETSTGSARGIVDEYCENHGLFQTTQVLREEARTFADTEPGRPATTNIRQKVVDACIKDFTEELPPDSGCR